VIAARALETQEPVGQYAAPEKGIEFLCYMLWQGLPLKSAQILEASKIFLYHSVENRLFRAAPNVAGF
jgi:hypothetical protein